MGKTRTFSKDFKLSVLRELETKRMIEVCRSHNLACSTVSGWRKAYKKDPKDAFKGKGNGLTP